MVAMPSYLAFGLRMACARPLHGLVPFDGEGVDVHVSLEPAVVEQGEPPPVTGAGATGPTVCREKGVIRIRYPDGAGFTIRADGGVVDGYWSASQTAEDAVCYLVGPIMRTILRLRGVSALHGSAVAIGGDAIAVLGPSGAGKSTTAAALVRAGTSLLTDDIVTLTRDAGRFWVLPGYSGIRLWPDVAPAVCGMDQLDPMTPTWDKRFLRVTGGQFKREPVALRVVYVLNPRMRQESHLIEPLRGREAFIAAAANLGVTYLDERDLRAEDFAAIADLVDQVPVRRVTPRADLRDAASLAEAVLADARRLLAGEG
jgi:hypothetical protein